MCPSRSVSLGTDKRDLHALPQSEPERPRFGVHEKRHDSIVCETSFSVFQTLLLLLLLSVQNSSIIGAL